VKLVPGQALFSPVDTTSVIVVQAPHEEITLSCGGVEMVFDKEAAGTVVAERTDGTPGAGVLLGKRYVDDKLRLELLCTKAGQGTLAANGAVLRIKAATPLPASD
jgi:hypothetical protein